jgi:hypothetical protein
VKSVYVTDTRLFYVQRLFVNSRCLRHLSYDRLNGLALLSIERQTVRKVNSKIPLLCLIKQIQEEKYVIKPTPNECVRNVFLIIYYLLAGVGLCMAKGWIVLPWPIGVLVTPSKRVLCPSRTDSPDRPISFPRTR